MKNRTRLIFALGTSAWLTYIIWQYSNRHEVCYAEVDMEGTIAQVPCIGLGVFTAAFLFVGGAVALLRLLKRLYPRHDGGTS